MIFNQLNYTEELGTGVGATIHDYGCAETDVASLLANCFGKDTDPSRLNQALISIPNHGGYASNNAGDYDIIEWGAITIIYSDVTLAFNNLYKYDPADMSLVDAQLNKGCSVIVGVSFSHDVNATDPSHYVEIYKKNPDGTYQCRDPWGGLDIVFDNKYAVNGMSVAQCILQTVSYNGTVQAPLDVQQIEDALRQARDTNWNFYQAELTNNKTLQQQLSDTQKQLTDCQSTVVTPVVNQPQEVSNTQIPIPVTTSNGETNVIITATSTSEPVVPDPSVKVIVPPVQPKPIVQPTPKTPFGILVDLIVFIKNTLCRLWKK